MEARADLLETLRSFFKNRDSLEIDVPTIAKVPVSDPWIDSLTVTDPYGKQVGFLLSSPEPYLKRCLAELNRPIHSIGHAYRGNEMGKVHIPEFSIIEWYRPMKSGQIDAMVIELTALVCELTQFGKPKVVEYRTLFEDAFGLNPHQTTEHELAQLVGDTISLNTTSNLDSSMLLDLIFVNHIQPSLNCHLVLDFPFAQAALSRVGENDSGDQVAKRVELYLSGVEIANGYDELVDVNEQRQRFENDRLKRVSLHRPDVDVDEEILFALTAGLPSSYGVALGIDRLLMAVLEKNSLIPCMTFMDI